MGKTLKDFFKKIYLFKRYGWRRQGWIHKTAILYGNKKMLDLHKTAEIWEFAILRMNKNKVYIGEYSQIGPFTVILAGCDIRIEKYVMIGPHCVIAGGAHNFKQLDKPMRFAGGITKGEIIIEEDVWIGANCTITEGLKIGKGAVIGANSFVNKDVNPYDIVGGVPAHVIGKRK